MNINKVLIAGNITKDIELKTLPNGTSVASFGLASNRTWKDANGEKQEQVEFHNIVVFGKQADTIKQYCVKGQNLFVEGRLQTRSWEDKESGKKLYRTEIILENFQFGQKPKTDTQVNKQVEKSDGVDTIEYPEDDINPEDIPF
jgi:single-strand DNA-binding protein